MNEVSSWGGAANGISGIDVPPLTEAGTAGGAAIDSSGTGVSEGIVIGTGGTCLRGQSRHWT